MAGAVRGHFVASVVGRRSTSSATNVATRRAGSRNQKQEHQPQVGSDRPGGAYICGQRGLARSTPTPKRCRRAMGSWPSTPPVQRARADMRTGLQPGDLCRGASHETTAEGASVHAGLRVQADAVCHAEDAGLALAFPMCVSWSCKGT
jgi:hypothetical protein